MGMAMKFTPYDEAAETLKYPLEEELYKSMSEWTPTLEQTEQLRAIQDPLVNDQLHYINNGSNLAGVGCNFTVCGSSQRQQQT